MPPLDRALAEIDRRIASGGVITDRDVLEAFAGDESEVPPRMPGAAVRVSSTADVAAVMRAASSHGVPVTARGAGTGRVGGAVPAEGGLVLVFEQMAGILGVEREEMRATVQPGASTGAVHAAAEREGLLYPPDPNSWSTCTIGGNVATNAGGPRAFKYGVTRDWVLGLEVVTAEGEVLRLGKRTRKGVTGYDLTALVVGSEGTLAVITEATLKLMPAPEATATLMVFLPDEAAVQRAVTAVVGQRLYPTCMELLDAVSLEVLRPEAGLPVPEEARAMLIVELDGDSATLEADVERCGNTLTDVGALEVLVARHGGERERLWSTRREMSRSLRKLAANKMSEDVVVPRTRLAELIERCRRISDETGLRMPTYGHAGDGNLHVNFLWDDPSEWPTVERGIASLFEQVIGMGGTLTGEHGLGELKMPYLHLEQSPQLIELQRRVKELFDPKHILNPGKMFPARGHGAC